MNEIVHLIPLGFEIDRAAAPFESGACIAHRVYLLTLVGERREPAWNRQQVHYVKAVRKRLEALRIKVEDRDVDTFEMHELLTVMSRLVRHEVSQGNTVFVNMSAGGRLQALGAGIAAMAHGAKLYYVRAEEYPESPEARRVHGLSRCEGSIEYLEGLPFQLPDERKMRALVELAAHPEGMRTDQLIRCLLQAGVAGFEAAPATRNGRINNLMKLNKGILEPLAAVGYLTHSEKEGRSKRVRITGAGRYVAALSGLTPIGDRAADPTSPPPRARRTRR